MPVRMKVAVCSTYEVAQLLFTVSFSKLFDASGGVDVFSRAGVKSVAEIAWIGFHLLTR